ncbi:ROK family transcriptional regulator [Natronosporangium hydrolyticum]|uniref:ROK family transcriptional regulator n=1 Tax=Natronosporangium hydrolyticum TaxID=2811111 RepID=A0A895YJJ7_9ACTN|nr:ROK family transcriptional regulator [Natronosporangium hydrolyticum]QSB16175.1 ROK family transcriptional regulator [Natronosporangium hydrolyticum]
MQARTRTGRAATARWLGALDLLRLVRRQPGITRAQAARTLEISSSSATEIAARLRGLQLLDERQAPPTGRGRPTTTLHAHADGPVVAAVEIRHEDWRVSVVDLESRLHSPAAGRHRDQRPAAVAAGLRDVLASIAESYGHRLRAVSVSVAATVCNDRIVQASTLGWEEVDLGRLVPGVPQFLGNDATLAGVAEARRHYPDRTVLYLTVEVGVGGILVQNGQAVAGATAAGGEFGHLPFGDHALTCPCGARGCWDIEVDGRAMARHRGHPAPADPRSYAEATLADDGAPARAAVHRCAEAFGRGTAGLVNALDPAVVALGGLATALYQHSGAALTDSYTAGLMRFRRSAPAPLRPSELRDSGSMMGAADVAFDAILTERGVTEWSPGRS